jgi:acyl-CoA ligase (AMP-forming) (exosortase A-associated)
LSDLIHECVRVSAERDPGHAALGLGGEALDYAALEAGVEQTARALCGLGLSRGERVAVWLDKRMETVLAMFGASRAGAVFVPVNPVLKEPQVLHILQDCDAAMLITSGERWQRLRGELHRVPGLRYVVLTEDRPDEASQAYRLQSWQALLEGDSSPTHRHIDTDIAAIIYTSGSTGRPKGVVLNHRNMVAGARSVASYLGNTPDDRILALLPLSFDAGLSQLTTAFHSGAFALLHNYLLPRDVPRAVERHSITGLGAVPPVWIPLARLTWPDGATECLRYITNTGGAMPLGTLERLRAGLPRTQVFLMYGLTEAFRSTYLPPGELDRRPDSMGRAIPNAEILVVRPDGTTCEVDEPGELVHRGALVAQGYWNDPDKTAQRFRPAPGQLPGLVNPEIAVWSGDTVRRDADGFLYFVGRHDEMIKTSGYRVSPTEVEEGLYATGMVAETVALGRASEELGQSVVAVVTPAEPDGFSIADLLARCRERMPAYMVPAEIICLAGGLPRNPNGKIDRAALKAAYAG